MVIGCSPAVHLDALDCELAAEEGWPVVPSAEHEQGGGARSASRRAVRSATVGPGVRPRLHLGALRAAAIVTRPPRHRGFGTVASGLARVSRRAEASCTFEVGGGELPVRLGDRYWMRLLLPGWRYEPEVAAVLATALDATTLFVDGGANIGYWSVFALGRVAEGRCLSVEASPVTYAWLCRTAAVNGDRFVPVHAALWDRSGVVVGIDVDVERHGRASITATAATSTGATTAALDVAEVETVTLDDLIGPVRRPAERVVVKLDVEGAEVAALRGARRLLGDGALVVYEDHGRDRHHRATRYLLDEIGVAVARWDDDRAGLVSVRRAEELDAVKGHRWKGYNLVAGDLAPVESLLRGGSASPPSSGARSTNSRLL